MLCAEVEEPFPTSVEQVEVYIDVSESGELSNDNMFYVLSTSGLRYVARSESNITS